MLEPHPQDVALALRVHADRQIAGEVSDRLPVADLDHERIEVQDRVDLLKRPGLPRLGVLQHGGGDTTDGLAADPGAIELSDVGLDLADAHPAGVQGDDLLIQPRQPALALADQLRLKTALAVPRRVDRNAALVGQQRLRRAAVAGVPHAAGWRVSGRIAQMLGQLLLKRPLDRPTRDLTQHAAPPEDLALPTLARDQLVDHPVEQPLAQLIRQLIPLSAELIQQRVDQLLAPLAGHLSDRSSQPGATERSLDQLLAQRRERFRVAHRWRQRLAADAVPIRGSSLEWDLLFLC